MEKKSMIAFCIFLIMLFPISLIAADYEAEADKLFARGGSENFKQAIDMYQKVLAENPEDYEVSWKCARAYREYGNEAKKNKVEGWKEICAKYGKSGMQYAQKAIDLKPEKPEGHYYYGLSVGIYSDGVSVLTALSEGLKGKTQSSFEKAYELDKMYKKGGPILSLGRFWAILPWPLRDRKQSLKYYREYQATGYFTDNIEAQVYLSELLIQIGGDKNKVEAKGYLQKAAKADNPYFREWASQLLAKTK